MNTPVQLQSAVRDRTGPHPLLRVVGLQKRYGSTVALAGVSFEVQQGAVHALLGENGAGKSTLVKILSGLTQPDDGSIQFSGGQVKIGGPRGARRLGIRTSFQEISLVPDLSVAQNFLLMEEPFTRFGVVSRGKCEEIVSSELARLGVSGVDPRAKVADLDLPTRQKIEIARSVSHDPQLLLLDEPTASLTSHDVHWLAGLIAQRKSASRTTLFISHRMQEVREFCSSLSVLRNGNCVGTAPVEELTDDDVIELMIGRSLSAVFPPKRLPSQELDANPALSARRIQVGRSVDGVSFDLKPGQILGVAGLQGMGQRELFLALFGALPINAGELLLKGEPISLAAPADAVAAGIGLVPEDRKSEGLFLEFNGRENLSLPSLDQFVRYGLIEQKGEVNGVLHSFQRVNIPARALGQEAGSFSGGNQQKMVLARWLLAGSRILLLYDPTRGVDIGTKAEIYRLINNFAEGGGVVLFYSSDMAELVNLCAEIMVLYRGRVSQYLSGDAVNETQIMQAALGGSFGQVGAKISV